MMTLSDSSASVTFQEDTPLKMVQQLVKPFGNTHYITNEWLNLLQKERENSKKGGHIIIAEMR